MPNADLVHPIRILHLEDDPRDAEMIRRKLETAGLVCDIVLVQDRERFEAGLAGGAFDLILCDYNIPGWDGLSALKLAREKQPDARVIVVSGSEGEEEVVTCLHLGAADYLLKQRLERLAPAAKRALEEAEELRKRRRAEEELRESEANHRALIEHMTEGLLRVDRNDVIRFVNPQFCRMLGYSEAELLGQHAGTLLLPGEDQAAMAERNRRRSEGVTEGYEIQVRKRSGELLWTWISAAPLTDADGRASGSMATITDITERRPAEWALRQSRDLLDLTGRMARVGGWGVDLDTQELTWIEEVYRIHEVDPVTRMNVAEAIDFYALEARLVIRAAVEACIDSGTPWDLELPLITAQGRRIWVRAQGEAVRQGGRTIRVHGAFQDITERKQAVDAVLQERAFSEAMLDSLPGIFFLFDHTGHLLRWNRALQTVSGYSAEEIAAMKPLDFFAEEDRTWIGERIGTVFETGATEAEATVVAKDGRRIPYYFVGVRFAVGEVPCCIGTGIDVTTRTHLEAQLRQSQKIEAIGRLAGGVAHDFNNILGVITGYGELVQRQLGAEHPSRARIDQMMKAAERAAGLTRQLMAFSRKQVMQPGSSTSTPSLPTCR